MNSMAELIEHVKAEGHLLHHDPHVVFEELKTKSHIFIGNLQEEGKQDKIAFQLLVDAAIHNKRLTHDEKLLIEVQMKDSLKTVGLISLTVLPGGTLVFILANFLKLNQYIIPSAFLKKQ